MIEAELKEKLLSQITNHDMSHQVLNVTSIYFKNLTLQLEQDLSKLNTNIVKSSNSNIQEIKNHNIESNVKSAKLLDEILLTKSKVDSGFVKSTAERDVHYTNLNNYQQKLFQV